MMECNVCEKPIQVGINDTGMCGYCLRAWRGKTLIKKQEVSKEG